MIAMSDGSLCDPCGQLLVLMQQQNNNHTVGIYLA